MKGSAHTQTHHGSSKEARKHGHIGDVGGRIPRADHSVHVRRAYECHRGPEEVRPDVDGLVVEVEEGAQRVRVGPAGLPVAREDEGVVATPGGEVIPEDEQRVLELGLEALGGG